MKEDNIKRERSKVEIDLEKSEIVKLIEWAIEWIEIDSFFLTYMREN